MRVLKKSLLLFLFILSACATDVNPSFTSVLDTDETFLSSENETSSSESSSTHAHIFGEVTYTWNDDYTKLTASRECAEDHYEENETVDVVSTITRESTCVVKGERTHISNSFTNTAFQTQTYIEELPLISHNYGEEAFKKDNTYHAYLCSVCGDEHLEAHQWVDGEILTYAQDNGTPFPDPGTMKQICSECGEERVVDHYHFEFEF